MLKFNIRELLTFCFVFIFIIIVFFKVNKKDSIIDLLKDYRDDNGIILWESIKTSEISMEFDYQLGRSRFFKNFQKDYYDINDGLLSSVYDHQIAYRKYYNDMFEEDYKLYSPTLAFTKDFEYLKSIEGYEYYSTYGDFSFKDYNIYGDINNDGYIDQLIFFSFCQHDEGTIINNIFQSYGESFPWRYYQGFGLVTKYNKDSYLRLIPLGLDVPIKISHYYPEVMDRIISEKENFRNRYLD